MNRRLNNRIKIKLSDYEIYRKDRYTQDGTKPLIINSKISYEIHLPKINDIKEAIALKKLQVVYYMFV